MQRNSTINKSQVFYRGYLPGGLYRLRNLTSVRITGARNDNEELRRMDTSQLINIVKKYVEAWDALNNAELSPTLVRHLADPEQFIGIIVPEAIYAQPFPAMLQCNNCRVLDYFQGNKDDQVRLEEMRNPRRIRNVHGRRRISCKKAGCPGTMRQVPYTALHRCGDMRPLTIPPGMRRTANLGFDDAGSSIAEAKFFDVDDRSAASHHALQSNCSICKDKYPEAAGMNFRASPVRSTEQMFPHNVQYLSLSRHAGEIIAQINGYLGDPDAAISREGEDIAKGIMQCLVGNETAEALISHAQELKAKDGSNTTDAAQIRADIEKQESGKMDVLRALEGMPEETKAMAVENFDKAIKALQEKLVIAQGRFTSTAVFKDKDIGALVDMGRHRRAIEAILLPHDAGDSRETLIEFSKRVSCAQQAQILHDISHLCDRYHVAEVAHYKSINVVMASVGFTREKNQPPEGAPGSVVPTVLNGYRDEYRGSGTPKSYVYALPAETEAIELKLSPIKVLQWSVNEAGWSDPGNDITGSDATAMEYLLKHSAALRMDPLDVIRDTKDMPANASAPFHLLHTISHCLIGSIKRHTGYDEKSVSEYLIPMNLSVILYVSSVKNYTSGGLRMLFEHYLRQWMDDACNYALNCVFDPICSDKGSSCSGCVQIVLGCETFNHGLSRCYIHGGRLEEDTRLHVKRGFWG